MLPSAIEANVDQHASLVSEHLLPAATNSTLSMHESRGLVALARAVAAVEEVVEHFVLQHIDVCAGLQVLHVHGIVVEHAVNSWALPAGHADPHPFTAARGRGERSLHHQPLSREEPGDETWLQPAAWRASKVTFTFVPLWARIPS